MAKQPRYQHPDKLYLDLIDIIKKNFHNCEYQIPEMASSFNTDESSLRRWCQKLIGISPGRLLKIYRIERAKLMLLEGERPSDVSGAVGFQEHKSFSTAFKQVTKLSPKNYRCHVLNQEMLFTID